MIAAVLLTSLTVALADVPQPSPTAGIDVAPSIERHLRPGHLDVELWAVEYGSSLFTTVGVLVPALVVGYIAGGGGAESFVYSGTPRATLGGLIMLGGVVLRPVAVAGAMAAFANYPCAGYRYSFWWTALAGVVSDATFLVGGYAASQAALAHGDEYLKLTLAAGVAYMLLTPAIQVAVLNLTRTPDVRLTVVPNTNGLALAGTF